MRRIEKVVLPLVLAAILLALWHFAVRATGTKIFPSPGDVMRGMVQLVERGILWAYIRDSLIRVFAGYGLAVLIAIPLGICLGWYPQLGRATNPLIQMLRPISPKISSRRAM